MSVKFSIPVVCLNPGKGLADTLESIKKQNYKNIEVVIKDGGSTDGSLAPFEGKDYLDDEKNISLRIVHEPDKGIYDAMNEAVKYVSGDYILFLNCGDHFYDETVLEKVAAFVESRHLEGASNTILYGDTFFEGPNALSKAAPRITGFVCYRNIPCHQAIFYSPDTLTDRGFDTTLKIRADFEHFSYCYFEKETTFEYTGVTIASYEGGGFSEKNKKRDKEEYKRSVRAHIPFIQRFFYRTILVVTLIDLRRALGNNPKFATTYQKLKGMLYKHG